MKIKKQIDKVNIDSLIQISNSFNAKFENPFNSSISLIISKDANGRATETISQPINETFYNKAEIKKICDLNEALVLDFSLTLTLPNQNHNLTQTFNLTIKRNDYYDDLNIVFTKIPTLHQIDLLYLTSTHFELSANTEHIQKVLGDELAEFYLKREESLLNIEKLSEKLAVQRVELQEKLEEEYRQKDDTLKSKYEELKAELETSITDEKVNLQEEKTKLEQLKSEIDDLDNTASRRKLREDLKTELQKRSEKFTLSDETVKKRKPINTLFIILTTFFVLLTVYNLFTFPKPQVSEISISTGTVNPVTNRTSTDSSSVDSVKTTEISTSSLSAGAGISGTANSYVYLAFAIRLMLSSLGLVFSIIYYIRWNDKWAKAHADEEFRLKRLALDIDRASWVVETALEWDNATAGDQQIPEHLLDRISHNLFVDDRDSECATHPTEDILTKIFGASSTVNVKTPMVEAQLDRKGVKRAIKEVNNSVGN